MSFASDIAKFAAKTGQSMQQVKRVTFIKICEPIIGMTPVDIGRAKGNWQSSKGSFKAGVIERLDKSGGSAIAEMMAVAESTKGDETLCMVNNLHYINRLENGYSKQAPVGMVTLNVQRFTTAVKQAVSGL